MPAELINILSQLPIVAVFIWYSSVTLKQFQDFLREERQAREKQMDKIANELSLMNTRLIEHDKQAAEGFANLSGTPRQAAPAQKGQW